MPQIDYFRHIGRRFLLFFMAALLILGLSSPALALSKKEYQLIYEHNLYVYEHKRIDEAILPAYLQPTHLVQSEDEEIIALAQKICRGLQSDKAKVKAIYDWVTQNIHYDYDYETVNSNSDLSQMSATSVLANKRGVCVGYAHFTGALLRAAGIPAKLITGYADSPLNFADLEFMENHRLYEHNHAWNEAFVDNRWLIIDATWGSGNSYRNGVYTKGKANYKYYDISIKDLSNNHVIHDYDDPVDINGFQIRQHILLKYTGNDTVPQIPAGITVIGDYAFSTQHQIVALVIPDGVTSLGKNSFSYNSSLVSLSLPPSLQEIGVGAFTGCNKLASLTIPAGVVKIGGAAFDRCDNLRTLLVSPKNQHFTAPNGILYSKDGRTLVKYPPAKADTKYIIPETVTTIAGKALQNAVNLKEISLPKGLQSIGFSAFAGCQSLENLALPAGITIIENNTFEKCSSLQSISFSPALKSIGPNAFDSCVELKALNLPGSLEEIGDFGFRNCMALTSVTLPNSVKTIGINAFSYCEGLLKMNMPATIEKMGSSIFSYCYSLQEITLPTNLTTITASMFTDCRSLRELKVPATVTRIEWKAFQGCEDITLRGPQGSYAEQYARENGLKFSKL